MADDASAARGRFREKSDGGPISALRSRARAGSRAAASATGAVRRRSSGAGAASRACPYRHSLRDGADAAITSQVNDGRSPPAIPRLEPIEAVRTPRTGGPNGAVIAAVTGRFDAGADAPRRAFRKNRPRLLLISSQKFTSRVIAPAVAKCDCGRAASHLSSAADRFLLNTKETGI